MESHLNAVRRMVKEYDTKSVVLCGQSLSVGHIAAFSRSKEVAVQLDSEQAKSRVDESVSWLAGDLKAKGDIYGVTTGFGAHSKNRTASHVELQQELIRYLQAGVSGSQELPSSIVRSTMLVRANCLLQGYSGVRWEILETLIKLLNANFTPKVPLRGSITASGDLMPLSYIAGVVTGRKDAVVYDPDGNVINAVEALRRIGVTEPVKLGPKEGLGMVNGTSAASALASIVCFDANILVLLTELLTAMLVEVMHGRLEFTDPLIHRLKHHPYQIEVAATIRHVLEGSSFMESSKKFNMLDYMSKARQDRYAIRTSPQWLGPPVDTIQAATKVVEKEINSVNDNPVLDPIQGKALHGGNFQGAAVGAAMDNVRIAVAAIAKLVFGQFSELVNATYSNGLPSNLSAGIDPCLDYGFDSAEIAMAAYVSEISYLANPVTTHVHAAEHHNQSVNSLGLISARKTEEAIDILKLMMSTYLVAICQAIDLRNLEEVSVEAVKVAVIPAVMKNFPMCNKAGIIEAIEKQHAFTYICSPGGDVLYQALRTELFHQHVQDVGFERLKKLEEELQPHLETALARARKDFEQGNGTPNRIRSCRSYPLYTFVRKKLETELLVGGVASFHSATPGEYFTKVYDSMVNGRIIQPILECLKEMS